jgi:hypothetical protein
VVPRLLELLDHERYPVVLLGWPLGSKGLPRKWGHLKAADMTPDYLAKLEGGNIGVALGSASSDLISVDVDVDEGFREFLEVNGNRADTLQTKGRRGGNIWWRMQGPYPGLRKLKRRGCDWGEWRSRGGQTIIYGQHPEGGDYHILNRKPPQAIPFADIRWPDGVKPPMAEQAGTLQKPPEEDGSGQRPTESHSSSVFFSGHLCASVKVGGGSSSGHCPKRARSEQRGTVQASSNGEGP